jgi:predicted 3-demethylubiquinone-9 3-methyltransferase (glyoxalase superfamily)
MQKITPFLWFDGDIQEIMGFYTSIFPNSQVVGTPPRLIRLLLEGQELILFNGGPHFKLTPAVSLFVNCETQAEIDDLWGKLLAGGGTPSRCGWLQDKYGLSWQLIPPQLGEWLQDKNPETAKRVMDAMLQMNKLEISVLQKAFLGE